jgi:uncharacterized protein YjbJ (UPF0337 family)
MNQAKGKWTEIKGEIQKAWGNLTDNELEKTKGDLTAIQGLIQQRYGKAQNDYREKLAGIFDRFADEKDAKLEAAKENLRKGA